MNILDHDDIAALKAYVRAPTGNKRAESTVLLGVTHSNLKASLMEIRFDKHMTVANVKAKLVSHTGTSVSAMRLLLKDGNRIVAAMENDDNMLGFYSPKDGYLIHVVDTDPSSLSAGGWLEDTSKVEKFKLSEDAYNAREKTYRKFKEAKLKQDPEWCIKKEMALRRGEEYVPPDPDLHKEVTANIKVGDRCEVAPGDRRGTVRFVGNGLKSLPAGFWVGISYDEPHGKHDGEIKGQRLFQCAPGHGAIVRPTHVTVGDFPEEEIDWDDLGSDGEL
jgi:tubulin-folding cofactor B